MHENQIVYSSNLDSFIYDFQNVANTPIKVALIVRNSPCIDSSIYEFNAYNLRTTKYKNSSLSVSPNPISSLEQLVIQTSKNQDVSFARILSIDGKEVVQKVKINGAGKLEINNSSLEISNVELMDGIYFIEILDSHSNRIKTERLQKIGR
jgi:hypothetical protein